MNIFFSVSSRINIDEKYIIDADYISKELAPNNDLIIGVAMENGMAGKILMI